MRIYVSGISGVSRDWLQKVFADTGQVTGATTIHDRHTRQSLGFGFVRMPDLAEARAAIARLNGQIVDGRRLFVAEAPMRTRRAGGAQEEDSDNFYEYRSSFQTSARRFLHVGNY